MHWKTIEKFIGEQVPDCIKKFLCSCGYDTSMSIQSISQDSIAFIENHINSYGRQVIQQLDCCHSEFYKKQDTFYLLPGHRDLLIGLAKFLAKSDINAMSDHVVNIHLELERPAFSRIMKELIKTALVNEHNGKNNSKYTDIIRNFATYIFLLSGRSCYQVLYENLPLPSVETVCKCFLLLKKLEHK